MDPLQPTTVNKEQKGLGKFCNRLKEKLKNKPTTITTPSSTQLTIPTAVSTEPAQPTVQVIQHSETVRAITPDVVDGTPEKSAPDAGPTASPSTAMPAERTEVERRLEKAQAIFKKYDIELSATDWDMRPNASHERVNKNISMRVRYTCHNCQTSFGHERICIECQHQRCANCVRYPPRKNRKKSPRDQQTPAVTTDVTAPEQQQNPEEIPCACHECQTGLEIGVEECPNCHHKICQRCLQEAVVSVDTPMTTAAPKVMQPEPKAVDEPRPFIS